MPGRKSWRCRAVSPPGTRLRSTRRSPATCKSWSKDIGALVKKGDELAEIDTPELDERVAQAREELGRAQGGAGLAKVTAERWARLAQFFRRLQAIGRREIERRKGQAGRCRRGQRQSRPAQGAKNLRPDRRALRRRGHRPQYRHRLLCRARAQLGEALFKVADIHAVRVYVNVPQIYSARLKSGMNATFTTPQWPDRRFSATVSTTSNAIGALTGSLLVELDTPNPDGALLPRLLCRRAFRIAGRSEPIAHRLERLVVR